jgi:O-antigen/teichoic acid export membrane protein
MSGLGETNDKAGVMTLWVRILQGVTAFSLETVVSTVAGLFGARLVFGYLPPADYGRLALFLSFYNTGAILLTLGLGWVFVAEIARARGSGERAWARFLVTRYLMYLLTMGTLLLLLFVSIGLKRGEAVLWIIMGTYLWLTAPSVAAHALLHGVTRYRRLAAQAIVRSLSRLTLLLTLRWWWRGDSLTGVALTYPMMELAGALVAVYLARLPWMELRAAPATAYTVKDLLSLFRQKGIYAVVSKPVKRVGEQLPVWLLKALVGDAGVGAFAAAERAYGLVFTFFASLEVTLFPLVSEQAETQLGRLRVALRQAQKYGFWLGLLVAIVGSAAAPWVVLLIAGQRYAMVIPLFRLLLWRIVLYAFSHSQRPILYAAGQQRSLLLIYVLTSILESAFLLGGIRLLGATGAVWAVLLADLMAVVTGYVTIRRLAPGLCVDPQTVFRIEEFDRQLWRSLTRHGR